MTRTLSPEPKGGRAWYHYRNDTVVETLRMSDTAALERITHGWDLWPTEWGLRNVLARRS